MHWSHQSSVNAKTKTFLSLSLMIQTTKLDCLSLPSLFSLILYLPLRLEPILRCPTLLALPTNNRLGWRGLPRTNIPAHLYRATVKINKCLYHDIWGLFYKKNTTVAYNFRKIYAITYFATTVIYGLVKNL